MQASETSVASANIKSSLWPLAALECLGQVLAAQPDLIGLQEWRMTRLPFPLKYGSIRVLPGPVRLPGARDYLFVAPLVSNCVVGLHRERFELESARVLPLSGFTWSDNPDRRPPWEPPRFGVVLRCRDRATGAAVSLVDYHLVPGVEDGRGGYLPERPRLGSRHRREHARVQAAVNRELAAGRLVYATGDSNLHGFALQGLTSAWAGRPDAPATLNGLRIDDVFGPGEATSVKYVDTASDHRAVIATRPAFG